MINTYHPGLLQRPSHPYILYIPLVKRGPESRQATPLVPRRGGGTRVAPDDATPQLRARDGLSVRE